ncbi:MAG: tRNA threonylcarbamoyladenosine dehydratase [Desulfuromonadales bacterium]|jgi:tRNA threonylcarbamoyladenosine dehydratase
MMETGRFARLELLLGQASLALLAGRSVAVFGLGGVGSYAVEALVRGGIGRLTLVDFDCVDITNCNRQIHALESTIGQPKALVMAERCRAINPAVAVEPLQAFYHQDNAAELLDRGYDYVLDCIDQITAKLHLIEQCVRMGLPIIASMGAANKIDPTQVRVADLAATRKCRLARVIRRELRRREIISGIKTVYSTETFRPLTAGRSLPAATEVGNYQSRRAPLGSSSVIPPLFGLFMAGEVMRDLLQEGQK